MVAQGPPAYRRCITQQLPHRHHTEIVDPVDVRMLPPEHTDQRERLCEPFTQVLRRPSEYLREGLAETLALIGVFGGQHPNIDRVHYFSMVTVRKLLRDATAVRWWSLSDHLRELAEASPEEFLGAIDDALAQGKPPILILFEQDDRGLFGRAHHADLLWGLELLAWSPDHIGQVTDLLLRLTSIKFGGRWGNRPSTSLRQIYLPWTPQTFARQSDRFEVLNALRPRYPQQMWDLMLSLYPKVHDSSQPTAK